GAFAFPWLRPHPAERSLVVVDALPWASIATVQREGGERESLPQSASTPMALRLLPGTYRVTLQGPPPAFESRTVTLHVEPSHPAAFPQQRFATITADDYFKPYLLPATSVLEAGTHASEDAP